MHNDVKYIKLSRTQEGPRRHVFRVALSPYERREGESSTCLTARGSSRRVLMRSDDLVGGAPRDFGHVVELAGEAAGARPGGAQLDRPHARLRVPPPVR